MLTAWAATGLAGPLIAARFRQTTGSYNGMLTVFAVFFLVALICSILIQFNIRRVRRMTTSRACCVASGVR